MKQLINKGVFTKFFILVFVMGSLNNTMYASDAKPETRVGSTTRKNKPTSLQRSQTPTSKRSIYSKRVNRSSPSQPATTAENTAQKKQSKNRKKSNSYPVAEHKNQKYDRNEYGKHGNYYKRYGHRRYGPGFNFWLSYPLANQYYYTSYQNSCRLFNDSDYDLVIFAAQTPRLFLPSGASLFLPCNRKITIESPQLSTGIITHVYDGISISNNGNTLFIE